MKYIKFLYLLQGVSYILFFYYSDALGVYDKGTDSFLFTNSLYSSGSDDDVAVFVGGFFCILAFLILLIKKYSLKIYFIVFFITLIFQMMSLTLLQVGSIIDTIIYQNDPYLIVGLISQITIVVMVINAARNSKYLNQPW